MRHCIKRCVQAAAAGISLKTKTPVGTYSKIGMTGASALTRCCEEIQGKENYTDSGNPNDSVQERNEFLRPITAAKIAHGGSLMALFMEARGSYVHKKWVGGIVQIHPGEKQTLKLHQFT